MTSSYDDHEYDDEDIPWWFDAIGVTAISIVIGCIVTALIAAGYDAWLK
jgi:hypothetical protein